MGKRELVVLLSLSSWCLVIIVWLFLAMPWVCLQFVIVVFPDHTHLVFFRAELNIMLIRIGNREDPNQKQSYLGLPCLSRPFWQATSVRKFRSITIMFKSGKLNCAKKNS